MVWPPVSAADSFFQDFFGIGARSMRLRLALVACVLAFAGASPSAAQSAIPQAASVTLQPGDSLRVAVWRNTELSGSFLVTAEGTLRHPLYQSVQVAGVPIPEVRMRIGRFLGGYVSNPEFSIEPLLRMVVEGQVASPGVYYHVPETSVASAVSMAGGAMPSGNQRRAILVRDGVRIAVDLTAPGVGGAAETVRSGDQMVVPRRETLQTVLSGASGLLSLISVVLVTLSLVGL